MAAFDAQRRDRRQETTVGPKDLPERYLHRLGIICLQVLEMPEDQDEIVKTDQVVESIKAELEKASPSRR
ncbi:MAG: hypothetical protein WB567_06900, partial [Terracidiphilus sp.]